MRSVAIAIVSIALHAVALSLLERQEALAPRDSARRVDASPIEVEIVDVVAAPEEGELDRRTTAGTRQPTAEPAPRRAVERMTGLRSATGGNEPIGDPSSSESILAPRSKQSFAPAQRPDLRLRAESTSPLPSPSPSPSSSPSSSESPLELAPDGSRIARTSAFTLRVGPDGHVDAIDDAPNLDVRIHLPDPRDVPRAVAKHLQRWSEDPVGVSKRTGGDPLTIADEERGDPREKIDGRVYPILGVGFDTTDAIMRWAGLDPYADRKRLLLEETFDERVDIGRVHRAAADEQSDQLMLTNLTALWKRRGLSTRARRAAIFELWDECAETGSENASAAGERARAAVYRFVDVHLPAGSAAAYPASELAELNARRRSTSRFAPYR